MMMISRSKLLISRVGSISKLSLSYSTKPFPFLKGTPRTMSDVEEDGRMFLNDREFLLRNLAIPLIFPRTGTKDVGRILKEVKPSEAAEAQAGVDLALEKEFNEKGGKRTIGNLISS